MRNASGSLHLLSHVKAGSAAPSGLPSCILFVCLFQLQACRWAGGKEKEREEREGVGESVGNRHWEGFAPKTFIVSDQSPASPTVPTARGVCAYTLRRILPEAF